MNYETKNINFDELYQTIQTKITNSKDLDNIKKAYECAKNIHKNEKRLNGDDFIIHPLTVASIVNDLDVDASTIIASLLHETIYSGLTLKYIEDNFGSEVSTIIDALSKMNRLELNDDSASSVIYLRKVLVGLATDVRVLFIKLADRLHNMRTNYAIKEENRRKKAYETEAVLIPIAHRLGINSIKSELENLCLYYTKPDVYNDILIKLNESKIKLNESLETMQKKICTILTNKGLKFKIKSRVKSVYSIYKKLSNGKNWSDIYDILALRIILEEESDCYMAMGLIHEKFKPIPKRFKDYIANPKANMYQSLHTTVYNELGELFEIQLRTFDMDEFAEKGMAAHWSYKEKGSKKMQKLMDQKLEMFRNLIEMNSDMPDKEFANDMTNNLLTEMIYVFTPNGDAVELPIKATPIDFAYRIHSDIGDKTTGALVNNKIVPLNYELKNNDTVKINTSPNAKPSKDWLGFVKTSQAKNKIKAYFSKQDKEMMIVKGKSLFEQELRREKIPFSEFLTEKNIKKILTELKLSTLDELYLSIGTLRYTSSYIISLIYDEKNATDILFEKINSQNINKENNKNAILIAGVSDILVNIARCCKPVKGDEITGFITIGQGITIHKKNCPNIIQEKKRLIDASWVDCDISSYITSIDIETENNKNYFSDIIATLTKRNITIESYSLKEYQTCNQYNITIKVKSKEDLDRLILDFNNLSYVYEVKRSE